METESEHARVVRVACSRASAATEKRRFSRDLPQAPESEKRPPPSSLTAVLTSTPLQYAFAVGRSSLALVPFAPLCHHSMVQVLPRVKGARATADERSPWT